MGTLGRAIYTVGKWIRGTGQAMDRLGSTIQGGLRVEEQLSRHRTIMNIFEKEPRIHKDVFVAPSAAVIGDVEIGHGSSIWYGSILRGDVNSIHIGSGSNIQDNSLVHVAKANISRKVLPTIIGNNVTIGHSAVLHACTVEDEAFVGMGATLLDGVVVEKHSMVGAGSLVKHATSTTSHTSLAAAQRPEKRPRYQDADEEQPAASECSEIISGARPRAAEVEVSESSCLASVLESDLACPEQLANDAETTEYSSAREDLTLSETEEEEEEVRSGPCICADCSFSPLHESSSSSDDDNAEPSPTFSLFLALAEQFVPFTHPETPTATDVALLAGEGKRFEDLDNEESYERFRRRERRGVVARDYIEVYSSMPGSYGRTVVEQRVVMVNWIIEHSQAMKLQPETMFIGIGLMDRFLTRGYVKGSRNIQLLGIACTTLATRIEENQPYNCILQKAFKVGINTYSRCEVVAMEWLVQEVLDFQCFVTTTHHFLWFYLKAANADDRVEDLAKYLALLSLLDHKHLSFWPSTVAAAVVALACLATNNESSCHLVMETHMRTKNDDLPECLMSLEWLTNYAS